MRVLRVVARGFMSYADLDIDLSELDTVAIVGDNGAGKSSFIEIITMALWGKHTREDPIYDNADECTVQVDFRTRGQTYSVIRSINRTGRDSTLTLIGLDDDKATLERKHTIPETQAKINRLIGLNYEALTAGPLMLQDQGSPLMDLQPKDRKQLLIELFGVEKYEEYYAEAAQQATDYKREADGLDDEIAKLDAVIEDEAVATAALTNARYDLVIALQERDEANTRLAAAKEKQIALREQTRHAETLRSTVSSLTIRIESDEQEQKRVLRAISDAHQALAADAPAFEPLVEADEAEIERLREQVRAARDQAAERSTLGMKLPMLRQTLERSEKLASIVDTVPCGGQGIYATCRFLTSAPKAEEIETQRAEVLAVAQRLEALGPIDEQDGTEERLNAALDNQRRYSSELVRREAATAQWELKRQSAQQMVRNGQDNLQRLETQVARDRQQLARSLEQLEQMVSPDTDASVVDAEVEGLKAQVEEQTRSVDMVYNPAVQRAEQAVSTIEEAKAKRVGLVKQAKEARGKAEVSTTVAKMFHRDGIPTLIIENGLPLIEERANEILERMPGSYHVRILTQRETKKGGMMDRVNIVVEKGGRPRSYRNLSGGQKFRVNFALRVAIGRALAQRSGATIDTLILDEGWGTQDKHGVEALLESIASVQDEFELILIITHVETVIQRIPVRLEAVLHDEDYSTLTLAA